MEGCRHRSTKYVSTGFGGIEQRTRCGDPVADGFDGYCKRHTHAARFREVALEATVAKLAEALIDLLPASIHEDTCPARGRTQDRNFRDKCNCRRARAAAALKQHKEIK